MGTGSCLLLAHGVVGFTFLRTTHTKNHYIERDQQVGIGRLIFFYNFEYQRIDGAPPPPEERDDYGNSLLAA